MGGASTAVVETQLVRGAIVWNAWSELQTVAMGKTIGESPVLGVLWAQLVSDRLELALQREGKRSLS